MSCWRSTRRTVNGYKAITQLAFKKTDEGRSCLAETSLQVLLTLFLTLARVSAKHNKFSIDVYP